MRVAEPQVVTDNQVVSIHTGAQGIQLLQFAPEDYSSATWGRTLADASQFSLTLPTADLPRLDLVEPWRDWASVYDDDNGHLLWTGPITAARENAAGMAISAKDHMTYLKATRVPVTKRWDAIDPAYVGGELWRYMSDMHQLGRARPIVRPDPDGHRYDFQVVKDDAMMDTTFGDLAGLGMRWTVFAGTPIFGPMGRTPVATLTEDDFDGDGISFVKDGSATVNDVLVRGQGLNAHARTDFHGQNLQALINRDSMDGLSSLQGAADAYVKETGQVRMRLELAPNATLKNTAPVTIDDLIPSNRFVLEARGIRQLFELTGVDIDRQPGGVGIRVTMVSVNPKLELTDTKTGPNLTLGQSAASR